MVVVTRVVGRGRCVKGDGRENDDDDDDSDDDSNDRHPQGRPRELSRLMRIAGGGGHHYKSNTELHTNQRTIQLHLRIEYTYKIPQYSHKLPVECI